MNLLAKWQNFYMIAGGAAATLTGLQFVVMALIADMPLQGGEKKGGGDQASEAFATPTIVHFVAVLMLSASMVIPWPSIVPAAAVWAVSGLAGVVYTLIVAQRMRLQTTYKPVFEDWLFHFLLPIVAYAALAASAPCTALSHARGGLFGIAGSVLLLLFIGIHNAWDNVTFLVYKRRNAAT